MEWLIAKHMGKLFATLAETFWCSIYGILSSRAGEWFFLGELSLLIFI